MTDKARRIPERIQDIREAIENARNDLPRLESLLDNSVIRSDADSHQQRKTKE